MSKPELKSTKSQMPVADKNDEVEVYTNSTKEPPVAENNGENHRDIKNEDENSNKEKNEHWKERIVPVWRRRHINTKFFRRRRGIVKISKILLLLTTLVAYSAHYAYFDVTILRSVCPILFTFDLLFFIIYSGFPHATLKHVQSRIGFLYAELIVGTLGTILLISLFCCRIVILVWDMHQWVDVAFLLLMLQLPLTAVYIYELCLIFSVWSNSEPATKTGDSQEEDHNKHSIAATNRKSPIPNYHFNQPRNFRKSYPNDDFSPPGISNPAVQINFE